VSPHRLTTEARDIRLAVGVDVILSVHGARWFLRPTKLRAAAWLQSHAAPGAQWSGGALAVLDRDITTIIAWMLRDGLIVR
jgi:hypothetical protein